MAATPEIADPVQRLCDDVYSRGVVPAVLCLQSRESDGTRRVPNAVFLDLYDRVVQLTRSVHGQTAAVRVVRSVCTTAVSRLYGRRLVQAPAHAVLQELLSAWEQYKVVLEWVRRVFAAVDQASGRAADAAHRATTVVKLGVRCFADTLAGLSWPQLPPDVPKGAGVAAPLLAHLWLARNGERLHAGQCAAGRDLVFVCAAASVTDARHCTVPSLHQAACEWLTSEMFDANRESASLVAYVRWYVEMTTSHYTERSGAWVSELRPSLYVDTCAAAAEFELHTAALALLPPACVPSVLALMRVILFENRLSELLSSPQESLRQLLEAEHPPRTLAVLYKWCQNQPSATAVLATRAAAHVRTSVEAVMMECLRAIDSSSGASRVRTYETACVTAAVTMAELHDRWNEVISIACNGDRSIVTAVHAAWADCLSAFCGQDAHNELDTPHGSDRARVHPAECIAVYARAAVTSEQLRGSDTARLLEEWECVTDRWCALYALLRDKDIFLTKYRALLSAHLLSGTAPDVELERQALAAIKHTAGGYYVLQMEGMLNDIGVSRQLQYEYQQYLAERMDKDTPASLELHVQMLRSGTWSAGVQIATPLPLPMESARASYQAFYKHVHEARALRWLLAEGTAEVRASFERGCKVLRMSTLQAALLCCFNVRDSWRVSELAETMCLSVSMLKPVVHPLIVAVRVLLKVPHGQRIAAEDVLTVNTGFWHPARLLRVPINRVVEDPATAAAASDPSNAPNDTLPLVAAARAYQLDAGLVRVMKTHLRVSHTELVTKLLQITTLFKPSAVDIKRRIEQLIERGYMCRDEHAKDVYVYVL